MNQTPLLSCHNLSIQVGNKTICENLQSEFYPGQCWAVLGQNGTGKTTLLHTLAGLHTPQTGDIFINQLHIEKMSHRQRAQQLGLLLQDYRDSFPATVMETVLTGRHPHLSTWEWESDDDRQLARQALRDVDLLDFEQRIIQTLSGGERRRVAIATLLAQQPPCMLLDEPANHLDIKHQHHVLKLLAQKVREENRLVIMVLHDVNLAARYCSHALMMFDDGRIELGNSKEMLQADRLSRLYDYPLERVASHNLFMPK